MNSSFNDMSLSEKRYNPGTQLTEKNNPNTYVLIGYDCTGNNMICILSTDNSILGNNIRIIDKNNVDTIIKENHIPYVPKFMFE
jgi:hypothetical protein